jgi:predicted benzoate:H+ symporter BenE
VQVYKNTLATNLKVYHPLMGLYLSPKLLRFSTSLPKKIVQTFALMTLVVYVTFSLGLSNGMCDEEECYVQKIGAVTTLDSILTGAIMIFLITLASRNYFEFLDTVKYP